MTPLKQVPALTKDNFMRTVLRELSGLLEKTVGEQEASAYVTFVGLSVGRMINEEYIKAYGVQRMDVQQVAATLVDLKDRIDGGFRIESIDAEKIVLRNTHCPFGDKVIDRPSLCRMTNNVFGHIAAQNLGYARVQILKAIARRDDHCKVIVWLTPGKDEVYWDETEFFETS